MKTMHAKHLMLSLRLTTALVLLATVALPALETELKPGMDKERRATIARWKGSLASGEQAAIEKTLAEATQQASVAFGMSDWPQAVAETAAKEKSPARELLLGHLRQHRSLINEATRKWINELFKSDVLDPSGEQVRQWSKAGNEGMTAAEKTMTQAAEAERWSALTGLLDAAARCGDKRYLPLAAGYLGHANGDVSKAALRVFKAHAKGLGPDLRSPKLCRIWWLQTGKALFKAQ